MLKWKFMFSKSLNRSNFMKNGKLNYKKLSDFIISNNFNLILVGHGASGKDYCKLKLIENGLSLEVSDTTREIREGEIDGKDYNFITEEEFLNNIENNIYIQWNRFGNNKLYGTKKTEFEQKNLFIMTPGVFKKFPKVLHNSVVIFFDIPEQIRRKRLLKRTDNYDTERRIKDDREESSCVKQGSPFFTYH